MTESEAFAKQAKSDYAVFNFLIDQPRDRVPDCHPLHYLQMATEKLAKAAFLALGMKGPDKYTHVAFSTIRHHLSRPDVARRLGWRDFRAYVRFLKRTAPVHRELDELNPAVGPQAEGGGPKEGPNVEYPWRTRGTDSETTWQAPASHGFSLLEKLRRSGDAAQVLHFVKTLLERFDAVFR